jgi:signal transduction histidine kinase
MPRNQRSVTAMNKGECRICTRVIDEHPHNTCAVWRHPITVTTASTWESKVEALLSALEVVCKHREKERAAMAAVVEAARKMIVDRYENGDPDRSAHKAEVRAALARLDGAP